MRKTERVSLTNSDRGIKVSDLSIFFIIVNKSKTIFIVTKKFSMQRICKLCINSYQLLRSIILIEIL